MTAARTTVVVATADRRDALLASLAELVALPQRPPVVVVDDGSRDGSVEAVRARFPAVDVVALSRNLGAVGRNVGVARARTPDVAVAHHHPRSAASRDPAARARLQRRNALLTTWMRRPWPVVPRASAEVGRRAPGALLAALRRLPAARRSRRRLPSAVEEGLRHLDRAPVRRTVRAQRPVQR